MSTAWAIRQIMDSHRSLLLDESPFSRTAVTKNRSFPAYGTLQLSWCFMLVSLRVCVPFSRDLLNWLKSFFSSGWLAIQSSGWITTLQICCNPLRNENSVSVCMCACMLRAGEKGAMLLTTKANDVWGLKKELLLISFDRRLRCLLCLTSFRQSFSRIN